MDWDDWHNWCIRKKKNIETLEMISHQYNMKHESQRASLATFKASFISGSWRAENADIWVQRVIIRVVDLQRRLHLQP